MSTPETTEEIPVYERLEKLGKDLIGQAREIRQRELTLDPKVAKEFWNGEWYKKFSWKLDVNRINKLEILFVLRPKDLNRWQRYDYYFSENSHEYSLQAGLNAAFQEWGLTRYTHGSACLWVRWNFMDNSPQVNQKFLDLIHSGDIEVENPSELSSYIEPILERLKKGEGSLQMLRNVANGGPKPKFKVGDMVRMNYGERHQEAGVVEHIIYPKAADLFQDGKVRYGCRMETNRCGVGCYGDSVQEFDEEVLTPEPSPTDKSK